MGLQYIYHNRIGVKQSRIEDSAIVTDHTMLHIAWPVGNDETVKRDLKKVFREASCSRCDGCGVAALCRRSVCILRMSLAVSIFWSAGIKPLLKIPSLKLHEEFRD